MMARGRHLAPKRRGRATAVVTAAAMAMALAVPAFADTGGTPNDNANVGANGSCFGQARSGVQDLEKPGLNYFSVRKGDNPALNEAYRIANC